MFCPRAEMVKNARIIVRNDRERDGFVDRKCMKYLSLTRGFTVFDNNIQTLYRKQTAHVGIFTNEFVEK